MTRLARLTLLAYPKAFRRGFGQEYLRTVADLYAHSPHSRLRIVARLLGDVFTAAPAMRWETLMPSAKPVLYVIVAVLAAFGLLLGSPAIAFPLLVIGAVLFVQARRHDRPLAREAADWGERWYVWLAVAGGLFLLGGSMLFTGEDNELAGWAWATWILSWLAAAIIGVVGIGLAVTRLATHRR